MRKQIIPIKAADTMLVPPVKFDGRKESLREKVYSYLRMAILSGKFPPQARLVEETVARELGVSRTPVRESLQKLEKDGLIQHLPNRGFKLRRDGESQIVEVFEIRAILEGHILRIACGRATEGFLSDLKSLVKRAERFLAQSMIEEVHRFNTLFHDRIIQQVSGKERLKEMIKDLTETILYYRSATLNSPGGAQRALEGHRKIILALEKGDPDLCERIMRDHIERARADAIRKLTQEETTG